MSASNRRERTRITLAFPHLSVAPGSLDSPTCRTGGKRGSTPSRSMRCSKREDVCRSPRWRLLWRGRGARRSTCGWLDDGLDPAPHPGRRGLPDIAVTPADGRRSGRTATIHGQRLALGKCPWERRGTLAALTSTVQKSVGAPPSRLRRSTNAESSSRIASSIGGASNSARTFFHTVLARCAVSIDPRSSQFSKLLQSERKGP